jgi:histidine ammonia-lyase
VEQAYATVRGLVPRLEADRVLGPDIEVLAAAVGTGAFSNR